MILRIVSAIALATFAAGCSPAKPAASPQDEHTGEPPVAGIAIPSEVRDSLGLTFARVERRAVSPMRRMPGAFELLPDARHEYRALLAGRVSLYVRQFDDVDAGDLLLTIDSPEWRQRQHEAVEAEGEIVMAEAALDVAQAQRGEAAASLAKMEDRIEKLAGAQVRRADLETEAASARNSLPRFDAQIRAAEASLREAREHYASRLNGLASLSGLDTSALLAPNGDGPAWRSITSLEIRAKRAGVVETIDIADGGWLEAGERALSVLDPAAIRFRAETPQSDIPLFRDGQRALIVPAAESGTPASPMEGAIRLGLTAHDADRTLSLYVTPDSLAPWARAGVAAYLDVELNAAPAPALAIPMASVVSDGLVSVYYRRNPDDPDRALRVVADLGPNDGRWTVVRSGLKEGDEVVVDGAYALKLSGTAQQTPEGYHYHADGSLHKDH